MKPGEGKENQNLKSELAQSEGELIVESAPMKALLAQLAQIAKADINVLITGPNGTGKSLLAQHIHNLSNRNNERFVSVNMGAISESLFESELFGHVKGAFTDAKEDKLGRFELAENGTIFLDEVAEMRPDMQVKLLRVLQERQFEPVGSTQTVEANVRIIAATHIDLEKAVEEGRFREDLFYRLNVIPLQIPKLNERPTDIPVLFHHFSEKFNQLRGKSITGISAEAMDLLFHYSWPGNIRELENLVERLTILKSEGIIEVSDLPRKYQNRTAPAQVDSVQIPQTGLDFNSAVDTYENALIMRALEKTGWNRNQAAILLKLNRTTLVEKIKKKGLRPPEMEL